MPASMECKQRLRAIRRRSKSVPDHTAEARLAEIGDIVSGKLDLGAVVNEMSPTLEQRLADGQASRSPRSPAIQAAKEKAEKEREAARKKADKAKNPDTSKPKRKRDEKGGRDRKEEGGQDRVQKSFGTNQ